MPFTESFPFKRLGVKHSPQFETSVWWQLREDVILPANSQFQLQWGRTDNPNADDWTDIAPAALDVCSITLTHDKLPSGVDPYLYFRVVLTTVDCVYVSLPVHVYGELTDHQWSLAREIVRKERLRLSSKIGRSGILLQRRQFGTRCATCNDQLTGQPLNSRCPECYGTGFVGGYYPPTPVFCFELSPANIATTRGEVNPPGANQLLVHEGRFLASPQPRFEDVVVDLASGLRYFVQQVATAADIRGVRLVLKVELRQAPLSDIVYRVPIGGEVYEHEKTRLASLGSGCVVVDHNYGTPDALTYQAGDCGIAGATILAIRQADYDNGWITADYAIARTTTTANGRWTSAMLLDPGDYVLIYEKVGQYGPDQVALTVTAPEPEINDPVLPTEPVTQGVPVIINSKTQPEDPPWRAKFGVY